MLWCRGAQQLLRGSPAPCLRKNWSSVYREKVQATASQIFLSPKALQRDQRVYQSSEVAGKRGVKAAFDKLSSRRKILILVLGGGSLWAFLSNLWDQRKATARRNELSAGYTANHHLVGDRVPNTAISRRVPSTSTAFPEGTRFVFYQYQTCPFCCKVRTLLDYFGIGYDLVEVNPVTKGQLRWSTWRKVPQLLVSTNPERTEYQQLNESSMIVSLLYSYMFNPRPIEELAACFPYHKQLVDEKVVTDVLNKYSLMFGTDAVGRTMDELNDEKKWRRWADKVLVHILSPNVYRTPSEALQAFRWFSDVGHWEENFHWLERIAVIYVGAAAMYLIGKRLKKRHNLSDDVRRDLYHECNVFAKEVNRRGTPFLGGERPNLADLAVYGVLSSIEGCDAFQDLLVNSKIGTWFKRTQSAVKGREGSALFRSRSSLPDRLEGGGFSA